MWIFACQYLFKPSHLYCNKMRLKTRGETFVCSCVSVYFFYSRSHSSGIKADGSRWRSCPTPTPLLCIFCQRIQYELIIVSSAMSVVQMFADIIYIIVLSPLYYVLQVISSCSSRFFSSIEVFIYLNIFMINMLHL